MVYAICWEDRVFVRVEKIGASYISMVDKEGYIYAGKHGFFRGLLSGIRLSDSELPKMITNRLPGHECMSEKEIVEFIKRTECRFVTDRMSVKILDEDE